MIDFKSVILPALVGVFGGFFGPLLLEKWKGSENRSTKQIYMEAELQKLEERLNSISYDMGERVTSLDNRFKSLELTFTHNTGILKGKLPDAPLELPSSN